MLLDYLRKTTSASPLAVFRIAFGLMLFFSILRFWTNGWIEDLYVNPRFFFPYYGCEFIVSLGKYSFILFLICGISALLVAIGLFYRVAAVCLFLSFTYIELIDKSTYLNHYYFISMIMFLLIFLPAHAYFSVDAYRNQSISAKQIPQWCLDSVKFFVCMLYFYAGLAKINSDWLIEAQPLKIWLPARNDMPIIGFLFNYKSVALLFSWFGCIYDLSIPFLLWNKKTRGWAYLAVIVFHLLTSALFPIGMFPYIMIVTALVFFPYQFHDKALGLLASVFSGSRQLLSSDRTYTYSAFSRRFILILFSIFFIIQLALPFRYLLYPGNLFWTEQGFRFSWRVMLIEKAGYAQFTVRGKNGKKLIVSNSQFLTPLQEKMMSTQPDMIVQYAHILRDYYASKGFDSPEVYVDSYVTLNGRLGRELIDPKIDLAREQDSFAHKSWILPFND